MSTSTAFNASLADASTRTATGAPHADARTTTAPSASSCFHASVGGACFFSDERGYGIVDPRTASGATTAEQALHNGGWNLRRSYAERYEDALCVRGDGVFLADSRAVLVFKALVARYGVYRVQVTVRASALSVSNLSLFTGRRCPVARNVALSAGESRVFSFLAVAAPYIPAFTQAVETEAALYVSVTGENAGISHIHIEETDAPVLWVAGDSTLTDQNALFPYYAAASCAGWAQALPRYLDGMALCNYAHSGMTTNCFRDDGHWALLAGQVRAGDAVLFQFGHNDQKRRNLAPFGGYSENLRRYVRETRALGAVPLIASPISRVPFDDHGAPHSLLAPYALACAAVCDELQVPLIDLHALTFAHWNAMEHEASRGERGDVVEVAVGAGEKTTTVNDGGARGGDNARCSESGAHGSDARALCEAAHCEAVAGTGKKIAPANGDDARGSVVPVAADSAASVATAVAPTASTAAPRPHAATRYFMRGDITHTNDIGADFIASLVAAEIRRQRIAPLCAHLAAPPAPFAPDCDTVPAPEADGGSIFDIALPYVDVADDSRAVIEAAFRNGLLDPCVLHAHPHADLPRAQLLMPLFKALRMSGKRPYLGAFDDISRYEWDAGYVQACLDAGLLDAPAAMNAAEADSAPATTPAANADACSNGSGCAAPADGAITASVAAKADGAPATAPAANADACSNGSGCAMPADSAAMVSVALKVDGVSATAPAAPARFRPDEPTTAAYFATLAVRALERDVSRRRALSADDCLRQATALGIVPAACTASTVLTRAQCYGGMVRLMELLGTSSTALPSDVEQHPTV